MNVVQVFTEAVVLAANIDVEGIPTLLLLAGPAGGVAVYVGLYRYYRNTDKSHGFEKETSVEARQVTGGEEKLKRITGTQRKSIEGNNVTSYRKRVQRIPAE